MAAAGADGIGVRLGLTVAVALGVAVTVLWVTGQRTGVEYFAPGGSLALTRVNAPAIGLALAAVFGIAARTGSRSGS